MRFLSWRPRFVLGVFLIVCLLAVPSAASATVDYSQGIGDVPYFTFVRQQLDDRMDVGVNVASGNLLVRAQDFHIAGTAGLDLTMARFWNSLPGATPEEPLGTGWSHNFNINQSLVQTSTGFDYRDGSQARASFTASGGGYTSPSGLPADLTYDSGADQMVLTFRKDGTKLRFDSDGSVLRSIEDRHGNTISLEPLGTNGQTDHVTDSQGRDLQFTFNTGATRLTQAEDSSGRQVKYFYTASGGKQHLTKVTDAAGNDTLYGYDSSHRLTQITTPAGSITKIGYDSSSRATSIKRVTNVSADTGPTTTFTYNSGSTVVTDPGGKTTTYTYDSSKRVTNVEDALGHDQATTWTSASNVATTTDALTGVTTATYDSLDRLTSSESPALSGMSHGATASWTYTGSGMTQFFPSTYTDPSQDFKLRFGYDSGTGDLTSIANDNGSPSPATDAEVKIDYNDDGTLNWVKDPLWDSGASGDHITWFGYDSAGNMTTVDNPDDFMGDTDYTYDTISRRITQTDGEGQVTTYTYDDLDRVTEIEYDDASTVDFVYDDDGNLLSRTDASGTMSWTYDPLNRVLTQTLPGSVTTTYTYDAAGNRTSLTDAGGTVSYDYNDVNLVSKITEPGGNETDFTYDDNNQRLTTTYPNGVVQTAHYDPAGRLDWIKALKGTTVLDRFDYVYTKGTQDTDLRQSVTDKDGNATAYTYDRLNRLTDAVVTAGSSTTDQWHYVYDAASNRTQTTWSLNGGSTNTRSYAYNGANEICWEYSGSSSNACDSTPTGARTFDFDQIGNLYQDNDSLSIAYNAANQSTSIGSLDFAYAGAGQAERILSGSDVIDNDELGVAHFGSYYYTRDPFGQPLSRRYGSTGRWYALYDGQGSVVGMTDSSGNLVSTYSYDPYGQTRSIGGSIGSSFDWPFRYTAGFFDSENDYYHLGERYYDPALGRFTQTDPINQLSDLTQGNRYAYVGADPVNSVDPTGQCVLGICDAARAAVGVIAGVGGTLVFVSGAVATESCFQDVPELEAAHACTAIAGATLSVSSTLFAASGEAFRESTQRKR
jgi:RHS repeat-associated protein